MTQTSPSEPEFKFTLISDMHVDFPQEKTPYDKFEKTVIVAGDTANGLEGLKFLHKIERKGSAVFACDGNHEHYANYSQGRTQAETTARFMEDFPDTGILANGAPIVLRNGWYPVSIGGLWVNWMNDSANCRLSPEDANVLAVSEAEYIRQTLSEWRDNDLKGVVVTHTSPCEETLNPAYAGSFSNEWYWNPLMRPLLEEFSPQIHVWCHGHTHARNEAVVSGTRVVCNPRGYPGENPNWKPLTICI